MDKLDTLQKTRLSSGVSQAEKKIDEIEKNLPADTFPPFKRDDKGNVIEPEKQLEEFQVMLVRVATYEDRRFRGDNRESPYPSIHAIAQWPPQTSANRSVGEFIKAVHLVNDMNFFLTFRAILPPVSDPVDLAAVAHAGRKQLTRENFSGINDWTSSLHNGSFVPPEIKYFKNLENLSFRLSIDYLPRSLESLKRLHTLNLVGPGNLTEVPDVVWKLKFLKNLFLDFNRIHSLSPKVRELEKLKTLVFLLIS